MPETGRLARLATGQPVFGPTLDALLRELAPRLDQETRVMVEAWPTQPDGTPKDGEALFDRLMSLRARLGPAPLPPGRRPGSPGRALGGLLLGAAIALPLSFLVAFILLEWLLPPDLVPPLPGLWVLVAGIVLAGAAGGGRQGARPSRWGHVAMHGAGGFLGGAVLGALLSLFVAIGLGAVLNVSQREGAFAMGVVFAIMPLGGLIGGLGLGAWMAGRAWRGWDQAAPAPP
ncbi:hypothetical protein ACLF3G_18545 [Falsiroseomonas sp. HC035]|uniref:hypothetical protein n=1 Tax=Falsiroseomonas sp. HC035 TaxID=3390999 RepID=UPI003D3166E5